VVESRSLFAYGTLELPELMEALAGFRPDSIDAVLEGYARFLLRGRSYPGIVEAVGAQTEGRLYHALDAAALTRLDRFEGPLYERRIIQVRPAAGHGVPAHVYVLRREHRALLTTRPWERARFAREHLDAYLTHCRDLRDGGER
jgi:gamma-glutamylcyclotransferase (GGCT)/AIG2-like uncharacterized protein YtfP